MSLAMVIKVKIFFLSKNNDSQHVIFASSGAFFNALEIAINW